MGPRWQSRRAVRLGSALACREASGLRCLEWVSPARAGGTGRGSAEALVHVVDELPGVAVGHVHGTCRRGDGPELTHGLEELDFPPADGVSVAQEDSDANARHVGIALCRADSYGSRANAYGSGGSGSRAQLGPWPNLPPPPGWRIPGRRSLRMDRSLDDGSTCLRRHRSDSARLDWSRQWEYLRGRPGGPLFDRVVVGLVLTKPIVALPGNG
jgi:hypothetical protein